MIKDPSQAGIKTSIPFTLDDKMIIVPKQGSKAEQEINLSKTKHYKSYLICERSNKANILSLRIDLKDEDELSIAEIQNRINQQLKVQIQIEGHYFRENGIDLSNPISRYIDCQPIYFSYRPITAQKSLESDVAERRIQINLRYHSEVKCILAWPENTIMELIQVFKKYVKVSKGAKVEIKNILGFILSENATLGDLKIKNQDYLQAKIVHTGGGYQFVDMSDVKSRVITQWSQSGPKWRIHVPGLNLQGKCKNESCQSYEKGDVVINMGHISFDIIRNRNLCKCPMCDELVNPTHCSFNNCEYSWSGEKLLDNGETEIYRTQEWKSVADECLTYKSKENSLADWVTLKIHTQEITKEEQASTEIED